jgi:cobalamin biosynthesis protein CbiD
VESSSSVIGLKVAARVGLVVGDGLPVAVGEAAVVDGF